MEIPLVPAILTLLIYLPIIIFSLKSKTFLKKFSQIVNKNKKHLTIEFLAGILYLIIIVYSLNLNFKSLLLAPGILIYLISLIILIKSYIDFANSKSDSLIQSGIYKISRNPIYFFGLLAVIGIALATLSSTLLLLGILQFYLTHQIILEEEKYCKLKYKKEFEKYMKEVSRYI